MQVLVNGICDTILDCQETLIFLFCILDATIISDPANYRLFMSLPIIKLELGFQLTIKSLCMLLSELVCNFQVLKILDGREVQEGYEIALVSVLKCF